MTLQRGFMLRACMCVCLPETHTNPGSNWLHLIGLTDLVDGPLAGFSNASATLDDDYSMNICRRYSDVSVFKRKRTVYGLLAGHQSKFLDRFFLNFQKRLERENSYHCYAHEVQDEIRDSLGAHTCLQAVLSNFS